MEDTQHYLGSIIQYAHQFVEASCFLKTVIVWELISLATQKPETQRKLINVFCNDMPRLCFKGSAIH